MLISLLRYEERGGTHKCLGICIYGQVSWIYIYTQVWGRTSVFGYIYIWIYIYIHTYIHIYIHTYIYIHIYMSSLSLNCVSGSQKTGEEEEEEQEEKEEEEDVS